jgi:hypothetical protein
MTRATTATAVFLAAGFIATGTTALELQVVGRGVAPANGPGGPAEVRAVATKAAKTAAVCAAVDKVLGVDASKAPNIQAKLPEITLQVPDGAIVDTKSAVVGGNYELTLTLAVDDKFLRGLLSDLGVAGALVASRNYSILAVMDEFLTQPRNVRAPLEELQFFKAKSATLYSDQSSVSQSAAAFAATRTSEGAEAAGAKGSSRQQNDIEARHIETVHYEKLVRYQPQGVAERVSQTGNALAGQLQGYDLRVLDNEVFRSRFLKGKAITVEQLQRAEELAQYVAYARTDANADYFMAGTSILIDSGVNPATAEPECSGVVTVKVYSTASGENIAAETVAESSAGRNVNDCAGNLARKLAKILGPVLGARIQEYWKRRAMYGREFVVTLVGDALPLMTRMAFIKAVRATAGVNQDAQRISTDKKLQLVVTYKGAGPLDQAIAMQLAGAKPFEALDATADGDNLSFCLGPCAKFAPPAESASDPKAAPAQVQPTPAATKGKKR